MRRETGRERGRLPAHSDSVTLLIAVRAGMSGEARRSSWRLAFHVLSYIEVMPGVTELDEEHGVTARTLGLGMRPTCRTACPPAFLCMFDGLRFSGARDRRRAACS